VTHRDVALYQMDPDTPALPHFFGESAYAETHVLHGVGAQFLPPRAIQMRDANVRRRDLSAADGAFLAKAILQAAEATTCIVASENGIGGPPRGYFLTPTSAKTFDEAGL